MLKIVLSNDSEIEVKDGSTIFDIRVDQPQYDQMWDNLIGENLKLVKLTTVNDELIDQMENLVVDSETSIRNKGVVECQFHLREKTEVELLREEVVKLREVSGVHDGAITDLAEAVSGLAEEGGHV